MKISLVFLGSTSACAIYSYQMATALLQKKSCLLQLFIAKRVYNIDEWKELSAKYSCELIEIETYKHDAIHVALSYLNIPKIYTLSKTISKFKPDVIYFPFGCVWGPLLYPMLKGTAPIINTVHDPHLHDKYKSLVEAVFFELGTWSQRFVSGFVILNGKDKTYMENLHKKPVAVIPHAAFNYYTTVKSNTLTDEKIKRKILFIGRIEPYKGVDVLVEAFKKSKTDKLKLIIAGGGFIDENVLVKINSNERIELRNRFIPDVEMVELINSSDFIVLPYKRASQSGVIPMAFALGKTVIATNVGSLSEQIPKDTGVLTNVDSQEIADAIDEFYAEPAKIVEYGKNAKRYAETELTWEHSAILLMEFCKILTE